MQCNAGHYMHSSLLQGLEKEFLKPHPEPYPEPTARSAVRGRRDAPSAAAAAAAAAVAAAAAAAVVVAAAVAKRLLCWCLLGTGQTCSRDCHARL